MSTVSEAKLKLKFLLGKKGAKQHITPLIMGKPGIGKSQIVQAIADEGKYKYFIDLRLSQHDETDFKIPNKGDDFVTWLTSDFIPTVDNKRFDGPGVLFLDEINRGTHQVMQMIFQVVLDRKIGEKKIRDDWKIVAAGNLGYDDDTNVNEMDAALKNRFAHIRIDEPIFDEWKEWAKANKILPSIISFLEKHPGKLHYKDKVGNDDMLVTPRTWEKLSRVLEDSIDEVYQVAQYVAPTLIFTSTSAFLNHLSTAKKIGPKDVFTNYNKVKKQVEKLERGDLYSLQQEMVAYIEQNGKTFQEEQYKNFDGFFKDNMLDDNKLSFLKSIKEAGQMEFIKKWFKVFPEYNKSGNEMAKLAMDLL